MQMKDVIISVTGVQQGETGPDATQLVTAGQYGIADREACLCWQESEITGMEGTKTTLTVRPEGVTLSREGSVTSRMEFQQGKKHYFLYDTPFGSATMGVDTLRIRSELGLHGGSLEVDYLLDMEQNVLGRNRFFIHVEEPKKSHTGDIRWPI